MASWSAPYYPWSTSHAIGNTDLTRIEENTDYLKDEQDLDKADIVTIETNQEDLTLNMENLFDDYDWATDPDITDNSALSNIIAALGDLPTGFQIKGLRTGIRKNGGVYDYSHVTISPGFCDTEAGVTNDDRFRLSSSSAFSKSIAANWTAGTNNGGFPSGISFANDTDYYVFIIGNKTTGAIDAGFDTSSTAVNLLADASGYTHYRKIGTVRSKAALTEIRFTEDYGTMQYRDTIKSVFPMATVGYTVNYEVMFEAIHNQKTGFLKLKIPAHNSGAPSGNALEYTFIANNTPQWVALSNVDCIASCIFQDNSTNSPGHLRIDSATPKLIASISNTNAVIQATSFSTSGTKGNPYNQALLFHTWEDV